MTKDEAKQLIENSQAAALNHLNVMQESRDGKSEYFVTTAQRAAAGEPLNTLAKCARLANQKWWIDPATGETLNRNKPELIALMHSELSEMLEGVRKDLPDDKLPQFKMEHVELVDLLIRAFDYAGTDIDLDAIFQAKMRYNLNRADHSHEARMQPGGKKF